MPWISLLFRRNSADAAGTREVGRIGERLAAQHARRTGMRVLGRNLRFERGEIDLLARDRDGSIVVIEVKSRVATAHARWRPEDALTPTKRSTLKRLAERVRAANGWTDRPIRVDLIAIRFEPGPKPLGRNGPRDPEIRHHRDALR